MTKVEIVATGCRGSEKTIADLWHARLEPRDRLRHGACVATDKEHQTSVTRMAIV